MPNGYMSPYLLLRDCQLRFSSVLAHVLLTIIVYLLDPYGRSVLNRSAGQVPGLSRVRHSPALQLGASIHLFVHLSEVGFGQLSHEVACIRSVIHINT
jgi:hypothetical protein